jgi:hypothetical protein
MTTITDQAQNLLKSIAAEKPRIRPQAFADDARRLAFSVVNAPLRERAPEVAELLTELGPGEWGADQLGTLANWLVRHGYRALDDDD